MNDFKSLLYSICLSVLIFSCGDDSEDKSSAQPSFPSYEDYAFFGNDCIEAGPTYMENSPDLEYQKGTCPTTRTIGDEEFDVIAKCYFSGFDSVKYYYNREDDSLDKANTDCSNFRGLFAEL